MTQSARNRLRLRLTARYQQLRLRLTGRLGSADHATAALNEAWLQLEQLPESSKATDTDAYLLGMATNIAYGWHRKEAQYLSAQDIGELFEFADEGADTERIVAGRQASQRLINVLNTLPERRRAILVGARLNGESHKVIAQRYGVSVKTVERELMLAVQTCQDELAAFGQAQQGDASRVARRS